jgi:formylmethanofuran dehydrogenase subunit E
MTLEEIANQIAELNDGCYSLNWDCPEEYDALTYEQKETVQLQVYEMLAPCDDCGWHFMIDNMNTQANGDLICWSCENAREEEEHDDSY